MSNRLITSSFTFPATETPENFLFAGCTPVEIADLPERGYIRIRLDDTTSIKTGALRQREVRNEKVRQDTARGKDET